MKKSFITSGPGVYVVPNVLTPRDMVFRPDNMDRTVPSSSPSSKSALHIHPTGDVLWFLVEPGNVVP